MRASEFINERKKKRSRRRRAAAYGPGPYGGYGYYAGYSGDSSGGDSGGGESVKRENIEQLTTNQEIEEGWKDWVAGAAIGAAALSGAGDAEAAKKKPINKPAITQTVKAPKQVPKVDLPAPKISSSAHENVLKSAAIKAGITGTELAAFLAQCAHETMDFKHMKEIGGSLDFKKYDPKHAPRKAKTLGNTKVGDGTKYKGRGYIQLTGRDNYKRAGAALGLPLEQKPELVEKPEVAAKVAVWFWQNQVAPKVSNFNDVRAVTKPINPGLKGLADREDKFLAFKNSTIKPKRV